jgi:hypothetical protein
MSRAVCGFTGIFRIIRELSNTSFAICPPAAVLMAVSCP